ncbi:Histidine kinase-, DNA gyrase B-, and HSP90-like ATPase [Dyella jiangningensis]|uniref:sensor histidine kinase n=2 Tax=Gammaproteobacteria TaxID=1236 RepID=UPI00088CCE9D|nr:sensor histidine kinase [Dyella sp. AtDHG13]PXV60381.1 histidine kinase [Dyella sp. AtDHG13]SDJ43137.1 Histidine kinase-, DNA gyrase B-, and HSP90-like ATPase [Dyella jiangningensis]
MTMLGWPAFVRHVARCIGAALLAACVLLPAHAGESTGFRRRLWTTETGTPADIWAMAQGKDGYLWLGTGSGLYRFDGSRFERFQPAEGERFRSNDITALHRLPDGSLWMGFYYGGAGVLQSGHLRQFAPGKDFPPGMVLAFASTGDGAIWAATEGGLARFDGERWQAVGDDWGYASHRADWLITARDGTLWVTTGDSLMFLRPGEHRFRATGLAVAKYGIVAQAPNGTLWISDHNHGTRALPGLTPDHPSLIAAERPDDTDFAWANRLLFDRYGNLWGTLVDRGGIYRVAAVESLASGRSLRAQDFSEVVGKASGLVSERAVPLLQDAEGTIWAGTNMGLASFHRNSFQVPAQVPLGMAADYAVAVDATGTTWIANGGMLYRSDGHHDTMVRSDLHDTSAMLFDRAGDLWMVGRNRLYRLHGQNIDVTEWPVSPDLTRVNAFALDSRDQLWLALAEHGLYRLRRGQWQAVVPDAAVAQDTPTSLASDNQGVLWIGYADDRLVRMDEHTARLYTSVDGLHVGTVTTIDAGNGDVLIGGEHGLARWSDGHIASMSVADNDAFSGITGIERTANGDVWLNTGKGVLRLDAAEVAASFSQPDRAPAYRLFDYRDGLPGIARQAALTPTATMDALHRLWFLTNQGPAWLDPNELGSNLLPPPVDIASVIANGKRYPAAGQVDLPKGTTNLQVQYSAASLAIPDRVRFRYRLAGVDAGWQDAGNRREAFYSNLAPGTYRFQVIAANDDGVWNMQGAEISLTIAPWFYQSSWFYALCIAVVVALIGAFFLWRTRLAADRVHLQLMERMNERERIARDIHDTLLQGVQGLLLRLQALMARPVRDQAHSDALHTAIEQARQMVIEGRGKIVDLRGEGPQHNEPVQSILAVGEDLASLYPNVAFQLTAHGEPRKLLPSARDEIIDIVREAIRNAFVHAQATRVDVHVDHQAHLLRVRIADDGTGIDETIVRSAADAGHWGIVGMRERAGRLGAKLALRRLHPHGTEWTLSVPCRAAYRSDKDDARAAP